MPLQRICRFSPPWRSGPLPSVYEMHLKASSADRLIEPRIAITRHADPTMKLRQYRETECSLSNRSSRISKLVASHFTRLRVVFASE